ncbi:TonB-dependent receptor [Sphingomonas sp. DBB INV C78]|uniref:TonB-dependent receptor n=1 Tax=Sphingomonas sp. DBB INV C78 TaxID=3349434 RepID=UPI0036D42698
MQSMRAALCCGAFVSSGIVAFPALAQDSATTGGGLEEIVVTAQKREERLQDTPLAVSAVTADTIEARGITDVSNLTAIAPSITVTTAPASSSNTTIFIRGVGNGEPILTADAPVSLYVDGIVLGRSTGAVFDLVDLERIEVLRGPQGTLYGRNTIGGAVNLITAKPADEFGGSLKFSYGSFNQWQARGSVDSGEFGDSGIKLKLSYVHREQDGYVNDTTAPGDEDPGALNIDALRAAVRFDKGGAFRADYAFDYNHRESFAPFFQATVMRPDVLAYLNSSPFFGGNPPLISTKRLKDVIADDDGLLTDRVYGHTLTLEWDIGENTTLRSLTGYRDWHNVDRGDELDGQGGILGFQVSPAILGPGNPFIPLGVRPVSLFTSSNDRGQHQWTQEFNLLGQIGDSFDYVVGFFYFDEKSFEANQQFPLLVLTFPPNPPFGVPLSTPLIYKHKSESVAGFAQGTYRFTDQLSLIAGIRYTEDKKTLTQTAPVVRSPDPAKFDRVNWAVSLNYQATDDILAYGRIATGYKAGGFNARSLGSNSFKPEDLTNFELGLKSELWDRRLRLNLAAFYTDHKDLQINQFVSGTGGAASNTVNAGKAQYYGLEGEMQVAPTDGLLLGGSFGYLHRKYKEFLLLDPVTNQLVDVSDTAHFPYSAKWTANAMAQYTVPEFDFGQLAFRMDYNYRSGVYFFPSTIGTPFNEEIKAGGRGLFDGRITLSKVKLGSNEASIAVWGKNLFDKKYRVHGIDFGGLGFAGNVYGEPQSFGVDVNFDF